MEPTILIKKYGNRRLYDTEASRYITLVDLEELLQRGRDVQVVDAKSGDDLTRAVLVQILLERDDAQDVLPVSFLKHVIRNGKSPMKAQIKRFLTDSMEMFRHTQNQALGQMMQAPTMFNPFAAFTQAPDRTHGQVPYPPPAPPPAAPSPDADDELRMLREELKKTQAMVQGLVERSEPRMEAPPKKTTRRKARAKRASTAKG